MLVKSLCIVVQKCISRQCFIFSLVLNLFLILPQISSPCSYEIFLIKKECLCFTSRPRNTEDNIGVVISDNRRNILASTMVFWEVSKYPFRVLTLSIQNYLMHLWMIQYHKEVNKWYNINIISLVLIRWSLPPCPFCVLLSPVIPIRFLHLLHLNRIAYSPALLMFL